MEISVQINSEIKRNFLAVLARFYIEHLKLSNSKYHLTIISKTGQQKETGGYGVTGHEGKHIFVSLDSKLSIDQLTLTFAHEMVHVKQIAKGQLVYQIVDDVEEVKWLGKPANNIPYYDRPWEIQAYSMQELLVQQLYKLVPQNV